MEERAHSNDIITIIHFIITCVFKQLINVTIISNYIAITVFCCDVPASPGVSSDISKDLVAKS